MMADNEQKETEGNLLEPIVYRVTNDGSIKYIPFNDFFINVDKLNE